jgi:hypothetical protein
MLEGMDKYGILEFGIGLGARRWTREGKTFLESMARAHRLPRDALVQILNKAPGELDRCYL